MRAPLVLVVILCQLHPVTSNSALQSILIKAIASNEEAEVAKVVEKALRNVTSGR